MKDFRTYSPEGVIAQNLNEVTERFDLLGEQEIAHLRELADEIAQSDDLADLLSSLPYYKPNAPMPQSKPLASNSKILSRSRGLQNAKQCIILCLALYERLQGREPLLQALFPDNEEVAPNALHRIVYQRSSYADDAYLSFASLFSDARAAYAHSFHAACEEVYNGHCEYCILPVENAVEGELIGFAKLIARYELKIAACCTIAGPDASRETRFALLRRNMLPLFSNETEKTGFFRCSFPMNLSALVGEILSAASFFGLSLVTANTLPNSKGESDACFNLTLSIGGGDLYPFLLYLATVAPQYTPIGIYSHIEQKGS